MKILKKFLQRVFKKTFQIIFKLIYGEIIYVKDNLLSKNILIKEVKNKNITKFNKKYYKIYKIKNGRIYTDLVENVAIIDEKNN